MGTLKYMLKNIVVMAAIIVGVIVFELHTQSVLPEAKCRGTQIKIGAMQGSDLTHAGFKLIHKGKKMPAKSWDQDIELKKDKKTYAYLKMYNISSELVGIEECQLAEIRIDKKCEPGLTLNGKQLIGADRKTACKTLDIENQEGDVLSKKKGKYEIIVYFQKDEVKKIELKYDFQKV